MNNSQIADLSSVTSPPRRDLEYNDIEIGEVIGSGGQAVVSEAHIATENGTQHLAVKQPARDANTLPRETIYRFLEEAQTWATVDAREREKPRWSDSEHIVGVVDFGDQLPWFALEYMDGGGLDDRLRESPDGLPLSEALWIGECVCRGVELAHNYGIAHLDLKPANVLFRKTPEGVWDVPKVADWGVARVLAEQTGRMEALSVEYAAPEQFDADQFGDPDTLTDVYQVGALMYAILTGSPPFTGPQTKVLHDVVYGDPPVPPSTHRSEIPPELDAVVMLALEREKADRYRAMNVFGEAVQAIRTDGHLPPAVASRLETAETHKDTDSSDRNRSQQVGTADIRSHVKGQSWPMFGGNPARTSVRSGVKTPSGTEKWTFETGNVVKSSPAVADDTVFVGSSDHHLYAVDAATGIERWAFQTEDLVWSSPAVADGTVFVGSHDGNLYAVDSETGTEEWAFETGGKVYSSPAVADGTVFVGDSDDHLYAVDAATGTEKWTVESNGSVYSSLAVADGTVFVGSDDDNLYAVDVETGTEIWALQTGNVVSSSPAVADGTVFVGSDDCHLYAIDAATGTELWAFETGGWVRSSPAVADGTVFVGSDDDNLYAIDVATGTEKWTFHSRRWVRSSPAVADGIVFVGNQSGHLYAVDAETGSKNWQVKTGGVVFSSPAVVDGIVFVGSDDHNLYAFE